jgi:glutaredoxin 3
MQIKVYSTPTCPYCRMLKDFLEEREIKFENVDVSTNTAAAREMEEKSGQRGVPQIEIDGRIIVGFDKDEIEKELDNAKRSE